MNLKKEIQQKLDEKYTAFTIDKTNLTDIILAVEHFRSDWDITLKINSVFENQPSNWWRGFKRKEFTSCKFHFKRSQI